MYLTEKLIDNSVNKTLAKELGIESEAEVDKLLDDVGVWFGDYLRIAHALEDGDTEKVRTILLADPKYSRVFGPYYSKNGLNEYFSKSITERELVNRHLSDIGMTVIETIEDASLEELREVYSKMSGKSKFLLEGISYTQMKNEVLEYIIEAKGKKSLVKNPIAKDVRSPKYKSRVIDDKKKEREKKKARKPVKVDENDYIERLNKARKLERESDTDVSVKDNDTVTDAESIAITDDPNPDERKVVVKKKNDNSTHVVDIDDIELKESWDAIKQSWDSFWHGRDTSYKDKTWRLAKKYIDRGMGRNEAYKKAVRVVTGETLDESSRMDEAPQKTRTKTKTADTEFEFYRSLFDEPDSKGELDTERAQTEPELKKATRRPTIRQSRRTDLDAPTSGIDMEKAEQLANIDAEEIDAVTPSQTRRPEPKVTVQNLPAVLSREIWQQKERGEVDHSFDPDWYQVSDLPGHMQRGIRAMGRRAFGVFTDTPVEDIWTMSTMVNPEVEVKKMIAWIRKNGIKDDEMEVDYGDLHPGYKPQIQIWKTSRYTFKIVKDFSGYYIYAWPGGRGVDIEHDDKKQIT